LNASKKPRGRPRTFDKEAALDTALRLFWKHGFEGTSIAALAHAVGVTIPSLYLAFGNKESLFMRAVERYGQYNGKLYENAFKKRAAREVARTILEGEVDLVLGRDTPDGCLMVQGALATSPESETVRLAMAELRRVAESEVADRFRRAVKEGDPLPDGADPDALAAYVMTVASGLAVQARTGFSRAQLDRVVEIAMDIWHAR
jgi:AcrR family transcriptional regulator